MAATAHTARNPSGNLRRTVGWRRVARYCRARTAPWHKYLRWWRSDVRHCERYRAPNPVAAGRLSTIRNNVGDVLLLAISLERLARERIEKLKTDNQSKNDPDAVERNNQEIELLAILADGFAQIVSALCDLAENPADQPILLGKAAALADAVAEQVQGWWWQHQIEATDWLIRMPFMGACVGMFNLLGADMHFATPITLACVGGERAVRALRVLWK